MKLYFPHGILYFYAAKIIQTTKKWFFSRFSVKSDRRRNKLA